MDFDVPANGKVRVGELRQPEAPEMWELVWTLDKGSQYRTHYLATRSTVTLEQYRKWMESMGLMTLFGG